MALPFLKIRGANGKIRTDATRLFLIAASECAFLWKTRCKRLLDENEEPRNKIPTPQEIRNRMITILNERLEWDRILTSWKKYQSKVLQENSS